MVQLSEGSIRGKDGRMYRGRPATCKQNTCESICWESQISDETRPQVPVEIYVLVVLNDFSFISFVNYATSLF